MTTSISKRSCLSLVLPLAFALSSATAGCGTTEKKPDDKPTQTSTGSTTKTTKELAPTEHFAEGVQAFEAVKGDTPDFAAAKVAFEAAIEKDPSFAIARYNIGVLLEKEGDRAAAKVAYRQAFDADPSLDIAVDNLGILLEAEGELDAAKELYSSAIAKNKEAVGPRLRLANIFKAEGDARQASILAREALQFDAKSAEAYRLLAVLYAEARKNQLARLVAVRGQKLVPNDPEIQYALAIVSENEKDVAVARALYNSIIEGHPEHTQSRIRLADMALKNRDWKTASSQLTALAKAHAGNPNIHNALGLAWKGQGDFIQAKANYEKAIAVDDTYAPARYNLGIVMLQHLDDPAAAEKMFSAYLDIGGEEDANARRLLADTRTVIQALADEKRMMAEMAVAEAKAAEEEAKRAEEARIEKEKADAQAAKQAAADADAAKAEKAAQDAAAKTKTDAAKPADTAEKGAEAPNVSKEKTEADPPKTSTKSVDSEKKKTPKKTRKRKSRKPKKKKAEKPKKKEEAKPSAPERDDDFFD